MDSSPTKYEDGVLTLTLTRGRRHHYQAANGAVTAMLAAAGDSFALADMTTGIVKWINESKGFGLITPDSGGEDLFARFWVRPAEANSKSFRHKQKVSFDITASLDGEEAVNIQPIA